MQPSELSGILDFLRAAEALKTATRSGWTSAGQPESVAEHTWRLCLMALVLHRDFPDADFALFPMQSTGLVSIPFGYLAGWLGSRLDHRRRVTESSENRRLYEESEARLLAAAE